MQHTLKISLLGLVLSTFPAYAQDEAPKSFRINNIRSNGTGCPLGTVLTNVSDDQQGFTLTFSDFYAEVGPALGRTQERKTCKVIFDTEQDANWEYAILAVNFRGFAQLDEGVKGTQKVRFGGTAKEEEAQLDLVGPIAEDYIVSQEVPLSSLKWSGCKDNKQKDFVVDGVINLQAARSGNTGLLTVDSIDGEIRQEYELLWRDCKDPKKSYAICRLTVPGKKTVRTLLSKGQAKNEANALTRARAKMAKKCDKLKGRAGSCDATKAVCTALNIPQ